MATDQSLPGSSMGYPTPQENSDRMTRKRIEQFFEDRGVPRYAHCEIRDLALKGLRAEEPTLTPSAWIAHAEGGATLHFSKAKGWQINVVQESGAFPSAKEPGSAGPDRDGEKWRALKQYAKGTTLGDMATIDEAFEDADK